MVDKQKIIDDLRYDLVVNWWLAILSAKINGFDKFKEPWAGYKSYLIIRNERFEGKDVSLKEYEESNLFQILIEIEWKLHPLLNFHGPHNLNSHKIMIKRCQQINNEILALIHSISINNKILNIWHWFIENWCIATFKDQMIKELMDCNKLYYNINCEISKIGLNFSNKEISWKGFSNWVKDILKEYKDQNNFIATFLNLIMPIDDPVIIKTQLDWLLPKFITDQKTHTLLNSELLNELWNS